MLNHTYGKEMRHFKDNANYLWHNIYPWRLEVSYHIINTVHSLHPLTTLKKSILLYSLYNIFARIVFKFPIVVTPSSNLCLWAIQHISGLYQRLFIRMTLTVP